jgi:hypothetical protein
MFSKKILDMAEKLSFHVTQEGKNYTCPSSTTNEIYKIRYWPGNEVSVAFTCSCRAGAFRIAEIEETGTPKMKYCRHIVACMIFLIRKGKLPKYWRREIYKEDE